ncbi:type II toxin-antitoxin system CcdA family antitoxin [Pseudomonas serbica]
MRCLFKCKLGYHSLRNNTMLCEEETQLKLALTEALKRKQCKQWLAENSEAVIAYNKDVEAHGVFSDSVRSF